VTLGDGRPVTVVGGGISGLAAALHLHDHGHPVRVLEAADRVGGKLRTSPLAGRMVDEGADAFLVRRPEALSLARRLGIDGELVHPAVRAASVFADGERRPLPPQLMGVPLDLAAVVQSGLLDDAGLARLRQDLNHPAGALTGDDVTVAAEVERRLGRQVLDRLVGPLVGGINAGDPDRLSLDTVVPQLSAAARDTRHPSLVRACQAQVSAARAAGADPAAPIFAAHPAGMAHLVDVLAAALPPGTVELRSLVEDLDPLLGDGPVVLALPAPATAGLLKATSAQAAADVMGAVEHASVVLITLAVRPEDISQRIAGSSGFLVPHDQGTLMTACTFTSHKWAHLGPEHGHGTLLLRASAGRHGDRRATELDDADLTGRILEDLGRTIGLSGPPTEVRVTRWPGAFPQPCPGHIPRMQRVDEDLAQHLPGVAIAGMARLGVGIPACIQSGLEAADRAMRTS